MTYKEYEKVIEQPKGRYPDILIFHLHDLLSSPRLQGGAASVPGSEQQGQAGQLHEPRLPRAPPQEGLMIMSDHV